MGIVRFALKFPYTFYVLAAFIVFLGVTAITVMPERFISGRGQSTTGSISSPPKMS